MSIRLGSPASPTPPKTMAQSQPMHQLQQYFDRFQALKAYSDNKDDLIQVSDETHRTRPNHLHPSLTGIGLTPASVGLPHQGKVPCRDCECRGFSASIQLTQIPGAVVRLECPQTETGRTERCSAAGSGGSSSGPRGVDKHAARAAAAITS